MAESAHSSLVTTNLHVPGYRQDSDPGAVGAGKYWVDSSGGTGAWTLKVRNAADSGWEEIASGGGGGGITEHDYVERTTNLTVTPTTDATAAAFITGNSVAYDGSTLVKVEFYCPAFEATASLLANLYEGSTDLGRIARVGGAVAISVYGVRYLTPAAASIVYSVRCWKTTGTSTAYGAAGGAGAYMPAYLRITSEA
jgi:hypothetical protein